MTVGASQLKYDSIATVTHVVEANDIFWLDSKTLTSDSIATDTHVCYITNGNIVA